MPLLILDAMTAAFKEYTFTFHYASTYTRQDQFYWPDGRIYIPLCFYLYVLFGRLLKRLRIFTFHYASTYTKPDLTCQRYWSNLHSTMLLLILIVPFAFNLDTVIYIPLCFYLYSACVSQTMSVSSFTFHYASTYTWGNIAATDICAHLHSTMLLLIHLHRSHPCKSDKIYIPLCFYLYFESDKIVNTKLDLHSTMLLLILALLYVRNQDLSFTFHYASTYTDNAKKKIIPFINFTFHYASTYTERPESSRAGS